MEYGIKIARYKAKICLCLPNFVVLEFFPIDLAGKNDIDFIWRRRNRDIAGRGKKSGIRVKNPEIFRKLKIFTSIVIETLF